MKKLSLKRNFIYNMLYQVFILLTPFITTPYVSRVLGVNAIGNYSYTQSLVSYFTLFAALGFSMYGQREVAYCSDNSYKRSLVFFDVIIFRIITVSICLIIYLIFAFYYTDSALKTLLFIQSISIITVYFDINWFFQGIENFRMIFIRSFIVKLIGIICIFTFVKNPSDIGKYAAISCAINLLGNLSLWIYLPKIITKVNKEDIHPFNNVKQIIELFIPVVAIQVYNVLDKTMIYLITNSPAENGYYEQTTKVVNMVLAVVTSLGPILLPHMANIYSKNNKEEFDRVIIKAFKIELLMACPMCFGLIAISDSFVPWFYGSGYDKITILLKIYSFVILLIPLSNVASYAILTPTQQQNKGTMAVCCGALTNFILNSIFIRYWASIGAAIATIVAETIVTVIHLFFVRKYVNLKKVGQYLMKQIGASLLMYCVILLVSKYLYLIKMNLILITFIQVIIGAIVYGSITIFVYKDETCMLFLNKILRRH